ncbi:UrcA family protein [Maricaulis sp.]|uniref:UrcA family protein n=1 Tax=Maricaulis sp. TaxID=1486257 RepID=UPI0025C5B840|nr:UrcA family protein [Maricaulis sp.]
MLITSMAAIAASLSLTPIAVSADNAPSQVIHFHTADLESEAGWTSVENRIREATERVCRPHGLHGIVAIRVREACFDATFSDAMSQLNRQHAEVNSRDVAVVISAQ